MSLSAPDVLQTSLPQNMPKKLSKSGCSHILIVEDDLVSQKIMQYFVEYLGYTCDIVSKGEEGVARVKKIKYALIFMDIGLPGEIDGTQATGLIRAYEREHNLAPLPIIAISAHLLQQDHPKVYAAGCNVILTKPTDREDIENLLHHYAPLYAEETQT